MASPAPPGAPDIHTVAAYYEAIIAELRVQNAVLVARVAELERQLGLHSGNSGKPPFSDGLKKPPRTRSLREASGKASGGQSGHPGKTLSRLAEPDAIVDHFPPSCGGCGAALDSATATGPIPRQVFDLSELQLLRVTEHRAINVAARLAASRRARPFRPACASSARIAGADRDRARGLGAPHANSAAPGLSRGQHRPPAGQIGPAAADRVD